MEDLIELGETKLKSGKLFMDLGSLLERILKLKTLKVIYLKWNGLIKVEKKMKFPEVDKIDFFSKDIALKKFIQRNQSLFLHLRKKYFKINFKNRLVIN